MKDTTIITKLETSLNLKGMFFEDAKSTINDIEKDYCLSGAENCGIIIAGSEPLDHPDLDAIIEYIASKNIEVSLLTRGAKLTEERIASWSGKVSGIGIFENLKVHTEDSDFCGFYSQGEGEIPEKFKRLAEAAHTAKMTFIVSDEIKAIIEDERKEKEQNMFYEIKMLNKGLIERSAKGSIVTWEDKEIKADLFPHEDSENYEIVTKSRERGGLVTVRRTAEISSDLAEFLIEIGEYDRLVTIEAKNEEEATKILREKYLNGECLEKYELSIEAKTLDDMIEKEADEIDDMFERLGRETLGNKTDALSKKRIRYEGMKAVLSAYKTYGFLEYYLDASKMPANEFNRLLESVVRSGGKIKETRGWKAAYKKYGVKDIED